MQNIHNPFAMVLNSGLAPSYGKLIYLGLMQPPTRSTFVYADAHRPWQLFDAVFQSQDGVSNCLSCQEPKRVLFTSPGKIFAHHLPRNDDRRRVQALLCPRPHCVHRVTPRSLMLEHRV